MAEYVENAEQLVALNNALVFDSSIPCNKGYVFHEDGSGIFILKGITNNCFARYTVTFNGNIAVPEGGTLTPIGVAVSVNGEARATSRAIYTPAAAGTANYGNVTSTCIVTVPKGCCFTVSVRYVDATAEDATTTPTPSISVINANLVINRTA